jgi:hypothetical protein
VTVRFHEPVVLRGAFENPQRAKKPWEPSTIDGNNSIGCV